MTATPAQVIDPAQLKQMVEELATIIGLPPLDIITNLQGSTARLMGDCPLLDALCALKYDYIPEDPENPTITA